MAKFGILFRAKCHLDSCHTFKNDVIIHYGGSLYSYCRQSVVQLYFTHIFLIFTASRYASAVCAIAMVCPSVRPSVTSRSSTKTAKYRIMQTTRHDSPGTLVSDVKDLG